MCVIMGAEQNAPILAQTLGTAKSKADRCREAARTIENNENPDTEECSNWLTIGGYGVAFCTRNLLSNIKACT